MFLALLKLALILEEWVGVGVAAVTLSQFVHWVYVTYISILGLLILYLVHLIRLVTVLLLQLLVLLIDIHLSLVLLGLVLATIGREFHGALDGIALAHLH